MSSKSKDYIFILKKNGIINASIKDVIVHIIIQINNKRKYFPPKVLKLKFFFLKHDLINLLDIFIEKTANIILKINNIILPGKI